MTGTDVNQLRSIGSQERVRDSVISMTHSICPPINLIGPSSIILNDPAADGPLRGHRRHLPHFHSHSTPIARPINANGSIPKAGHVTFSFLITMTQRASHKRHGYGHERAAHRQPSQTAQRARDAVAHPRQTAAHADATPAL